MDIEEFTALIEEITAIFKNMTRLAQMSWKWNDKQFRDNAKKFLEHSVLKAIADNNFSTISEDFKNLTTKDKKTWTHNKAIMKFWEQALESRSDAWDNLHDSSLKKENPLTVKIP